MRDAGGGAAQQALGHKRIQTTLILIYAKIVEDSQHHTPCSGSGTALLPGGRADASGRGSRGRARSSSSMADSYRSAAD